MPRHAIVDCRSPALVHSRCELVHEVGVGAAVPGFNAHGSEPLRRPPPGASEAPQRHRWILDAVAHVQLGALDVAAAVRAVLRSRSVGNRRAALDRRPLKGAEIAVGVEALAVAACVLEERHGHLRRKAFAAREPERCRLDREWAIPSRACDGSRRPEPRHDTDSATAPARPSSGATMSIAYCMGAQPSQYGGNPSRSCM